MLQVNFFKRSKFLIFLQPGTNVEKKLKNTFFYMVPNTVHSGNSDELNGTTIDKTNKNHLK
jgi:hypothetical protein